MIIIIIIIRIIIIILITKKKLLYHYYYHYYYCYYYCCCYLFGKTHSKYYVKLMFAISHIVLCHSCLVIFEVCNFNMKIKCDYYYYSHYYWMNVLHRI